MLESNIDNKHIRMLKKLQIMDHNSIVLKMDLSKGSVYI